MTKQEEFKKAIENNDLILIKTLLKDPRVDPSENDYKEVIDTLLNYKGVYNRLKYENNKLYKESIHYRTEKI